jgi:hypothetical protein
MKAIAAAILIATATTAATTTAMAQAPSTVLVNEDGEVVDTLLLRYSFDAMWALDTQRILLRDSYRDHYLLTLDAPCEKLDMDRSVTFVPPLTGRIKASLTYEARDKAGPPCDIAKVEWIGKEQAAALRAEAAQG